MFLFSRRVEVQSFDRLGPGGHEGRFSRDHLTVFSAGGPCEQLWHGQVCPLFDVVLSAFPLPTTASPTLQSCPERETERETERVSDGEEAGT